MTQHITQEVAETIRESCYGQSNLSEFYRAMMNAAIQHYLDQHKAEFPVLPEWSKQDNLGGLVPSEIRMSMRDFGQQCAAQARGLALDEAKSLISKLDAMVVSLKPYEIVNAIEALKGK